VLVKSCHSGPEGGEKGMEGEASHCSSVKTRSSHQTSREGEQGVEVQTTNQTIKDQACLSRDKLQEPDTFPR